MGDTSKEFLQKQCQMLEGNGELSRSELRPVHISPGTLNQSAGSAVPQKTDWSQ